MWFADVVKSWLFMESGSCGAKECGDFRGVEGVSNGSRALRKTKQLEMVVVLPLVVSSYYCPGTLVIHILKKVAGAY